MSEDRPFVVTPPEDERIGTPIGWHETATNTDTRSAPVRDAAVNPKADDFIPLRPVAGKPGVVMHAEVGTPEYEAAVRAMRDQNN